MNNGSHPSRVGRYAIVECVGSGASGPVYSAVDDVMGRRVAVRLGRAGDPRVYHQARVTGQVAHPNVVSIPDLGEEQGIPFPVMELLEGASLLQDSLTTLEDRLTAMHRKRRGTPRLPERYSFGKIISSRGFSRMGRFGHT